MQIHCFTLFYNTAAFLTTLVCLHFVGSGKEKPIKLHLATSVFLFPMTAGNLYFALVCGQYLVSQYTGGDLPPEDFESADQTKPLKGRQQYGAVSDRSASAAAVGYGSRRGTSGGKNSHRAAGCHSFRAWKEDKEAGTDKKGDRAKSSHTPSKSSSSKSKSKRKSQSQAQDQTSNEDPETQRSGPAPSIGELPTPQPHLLDSSRDFKRNWGVTADLGNAGAAQPDQADPLANFDVESGLPAGVSWGFQNDTDTDDGGLLSPAETEKGKEKEKEEEGRAGDQGGQGSMPLGQQESALPEPADLGGTGDP
uniref:Transmembrane protein n=1 Tax=Chromera velia CCMP2878 TaxID=1169474 RepID=A0A0G4HK11_9ALVE|eukprot:Cvel_28301.t1-p1 / transcript=Cvel_28301.t1 / gene=Cvel_28301 / organism=Chromera_velia_CCMP2878 / gene_product=hypothetical protein / transcript_product=hypothetical protein / location=Cvel_scaffold3673:3142-4300(+) / protein_length=307 / sequence_SO=supercontig / SO=protein_coding / is_pseudo=false